MKEELLQKSIIIFLRICKKAEVEMRDKNILITGANGTIGYELVKQLNENNKVIAVDQLFNNLHAYSDKVTFAKADICDREQMEPLFKNIDYVVHLAAKVHVLPKCDEDIKQFYKINTEASNNIFELCVKYSVKKIIFFSTIGVYGNKKGVINELTEPNPVTPYGKSKYEAEKLGLQLVKEKGLPLVILRPATIFGNLDRGNYKSLISLCKRRLSLIPGEGTNFKPIIYVKDVANAVINIMNKEIHPGEIFILSQGNYKYIDIIRSIEQVMKIKTLKLRIPLYIINILNKFFTIRIFKKVKTLSESIEVDNAKMINILDYTPQYNFKMGLNDSMDYYNE